MVLEISPGLEQRLQAFASADGRSASDLAREAIERYLRSIEELTSDLREAEAEADREGWLTTEEVFGRLNERSKKLHEGDLDASRSL